MKKPARLAATLTSVAVLFACTLKKTDVGPASRNDSAEGGTEAVAVLKLSDIQSKGDAALAKEAKPRKKELMDRLYPQPTAASPTVAVPSSPAKDEKQVRTASHRSYDRLVSNLQETGTLAAAQTGAVGQGAPSGNQPYASPRSRSYAAAKSAAGAAYPAERRAEPNNFREDDGEYRDQECYRCPPPAPQPNTEEYAPIYENPFLEAKANPLSTFSIDVDGASYSNTRRFLQEGQLPPADAVRIEEFINSFEYDYPQPNGSDPFSITTEVATTPWNAATKLVHIGLQGRRMNSEKLPPNNLVFLIDVSGSMNSPDKLPLLKNGFQMLIDQMRPQDRVSMVVYAGAAGMVLPPTSGSDKQAIREALDRLEAGGSTAGGAGLLLAYQAAKQSFIPGGSNRVILATDGDFNVGVSSDAELVRLIEEKRKSGVFLSVLGFGTGNYKDAKMEQLADKGNGNYFYIDNINEARKVLVEKMAGTLYAIAKDVKLQIEFNPAQVQAYRLVGYENRMLAAEDFNDDRKDAGELGAGTNVTALYEIVPAVPNRPKVDPLKYQDNGGSRWHWNFGGHGNAGGELLTVKFRYKQPNGSSSKLLSRVLSDRDAAWQDASENFRFSAAAAGFGLMLRGSRFAGDLDYDKVASIARGAKGRDLQGHRAEFISLVETARTLSGAGQVGYRQNRE
jgi:Ca-activated chloride channel family protein